MEEKEISFTLRNESDNDRQEKREGEIIWRLVLFIFVWMTV